MDSLFHSLPFVFIYLDNILIFSNSHSAHLAKLKQVFQILTTNSLHINVSLPLLRLIASATM
jgi:hypothetical protein